MPDPKVRDLCAHVIQLCDYFEDLRIDPKLSAIDIGVLRAKATQVREIAWTFNDQSKGQPT